MTKIIAFSGRKQSGKSTGAEYIQHLLLDRGISHKVYSFADPLKQDICMNILGLTYDQCYGSDIDKNTLTNIQWNNKQLTAREVMEVVGTEIFRKLRNDVWVTSTINKIKLENYDIAIIADCRFPNEVDSIIENNGYVIRLTLDPFHSNADAEIALDRDKYDWHKFTIVIDNCNMDIGSKNLAISKFLHIEGIIN